VNAGMNIEVEGRPDDNILSVLNHSFKRSLKVYPNPTDQFLNIKVSEDEELIIIQLRDAQGKLIKEISGNQLPLIINMELPDIQMSYCNL